MMRIFVHWPARRDARPTGSDLPASGIWDRKNESAGTCRTYFMHAKGLLDG
jgi:hypothetical protein